MSSDDAPAPAVVITGTSSGIGRATARLLDREGFRVFAAVRRLEDEGPLRAGASRRLAPLLMDVTDGAAVELAAKQVEVAVGAAGLAGLVNNAGIAVGSPLEFVSIDELRRQFEVNVFGPAAVTRAFLPLLRRARGRIVNVSSGAGLLATPLLGPYCASKFALEALSDALRLELRGSGMPVVLIEPGNVATPMLDKGRSQAEAILEGLPPHGRELYAGALERFARMTESLGRRASSPDAVARAVLRALTRRRPPPRIPVGSDAKLIAWLVRFLPTRARDAILGRLLGL